MNLVQKFNALDTTTVKRADLVALLQQAKKEQNNLVLERLTSVLTTYGDAEFTISIKNPIQEVEALGLNGYAEDFDLDMLQGVIPYFSEKDDDSLGLGKAVSPSEIYSYVTDLMINTITEVGHLPWQKEWTGSGATGEAMNYVSKKPYSGVNFFLLNFEVVVVNNRKIILPITFDQPYYLTFNQIEKAGATLKAGSKGAKVMYYTIVFDYKSDTLSFKTSDRAKFTAFVRLNNLTKEDFKDYLSKYPVLKYYNVFRADDCIGLKKHPKIESEVNPILAAQHIIDGYPNPPKYTFVGSDAYYIPSKDLINMPKIKAFKKESFYYCTYFHEMIHSTGHSKRLDRGNDTRVRDGSKEDKKAYAFEELVAELGAVFLCAEAGILYHTKENSAKYLNGWNKSLVEEMENDNRFFFKASAKAQKGANWILDRIKEEEEELEIPKNKIPNSNKKQPKKAKIKTSQKIQKIRKVKNKVAVSKPIVKAVVKKKTPLKSSGLNAVQPKVTVSSSKNKTIASLEKLGFVSASKVPDTPKDVFCLPGEIGKLLQKIQPHKALILIKGTKHTSKSQLAMQIANAFGEMGKPVAYIDYEQGGMDSKDTIDSLNRNTSLQGRKLIAIKGFLEKPLEELKSYCKYCEVIIADSVTDLGISADELGDLRVSFPKVIWVFISQVKENGEMYGGNKMAHNPTMIIKCHPASKPEERYATLEKNRGNDLELRYSIFYKKLLPESQNISQNNKPSAKAKGTVNKPIMPLTPKSKLSFSVK